MSDHSKNINQISPAIGATDRQQLAREQAAKTSRWPRTERRQQRVREVLAHRQNDLTVVLENVHDPHNVSAVLRACDAVGILEIHTIYSEEEPPKEAYSRTTSASAAKWISVRQHESVESCYAHLRSNKFRIAATALTDESHDLYETNLVEPIALVFGNEMRGISAEAATGADFLLYIPMLGMVQSLNISVACAVTLYEALRQRRLHGSYDEPTLSDDIRQTLADEWLKR